MQGAEIDRDEEIRQLAYRYWQEDGCQNGAELQHWLKAEEIWLEEHRPKSEPTAPKSPKGRKPRKSHAVKREL